MDTREIMMAGPVALIVTATMTASGIATTDARTTPIAIEPSANADTVTNPCPVLALAHTTNILDDKVEIIQSKLNNGFKRTIAYMSGGSQCPYRQ